MAVAECMFDELDKQAVEAIRKGDRERYRELIERYERRVFAVAWSRLGNADLAADATQEAFIKGYRRLAYLNHGGKFAPWITTIARNVAINLGLRQSNELKKRKLWALEQVEPASNAAQDAPVSAETMRTTLAELPARHRECLSLFYLEGKSVADAAAALGLSENAFKTRLHRARGVLRQQLEDKLETSLKNLRPPSALAPAIMVFVTMHPAEAAVTTGVAGIAAKIMAGTVQLLPFTFWFVSVWLLSVIPGMRLARQMERLELANYRDPEGFRVRLRRATAKRYRAWWPIMQFVFLGIAYGCMFFGRFDAYWRIVGPVLLISVAIHLRSLVINRGQNLVCSLAAFLLIVTGFFGLFLFGWPVFLVCWAGFFVLMYFAGRDRAETLDYNLFLRAAQDMIPAVRAETARPLRRDEIMAFARFLGRRWLVVDYRHDSRGSRFRLMPVGAYPMGLWLPFVWRRASMLAIGFDGSVQATLGSKDEQSLAELMGESVPKRQELESRVNTAVQAACHAFLAGRVSEAERYVGQQPEEAIFHENPRTGKAARLARRWVIGSLLGMAFFITLMLVMDKFDLDYVGYDPVNITETDVRNTLARLSTSERIESEMWKQLDDGIQWSFTLPPKDFFTADAWRNVCDHLWRSSLARDGLVSDSPKLIITALLDSDRLQKAFLSGLITESDLNDAGVTASTMRAYLQRLSPLELSHLVEPDEIPESEMEFSILDIDRQTLRLQVLQRFDCLDLVNVRPIIAPLRTHQVLVEKARDHGLFRCYFFKQPLRDTYRALVILSVVGGLDQIDRPACVDGILRFHRGKGLFLSIRKDILFTGDATETFCAYESLRMLGALDRVKDLDQWKFRPIPTPGIAAGFPRTWAEIEAWLYQQRLNRYLAQRRQNPQLAPPSLLTPVE